MKTAGITGGMGSGKTTVCKLFELLGIPVFYADDEAKKLYNDKKIISKVSDAFGKTILDKTGKVNKKALANKVFGNSANLQQLNNIIHPEIKRKFKEWKKKQKGNEYVIKEAAIMIESGSYKDLDYLITVSANEKERIKRIARRDSTSYSEIKKRIREQLTDKARARYADAVIINDGKHSLIRQVLKIHKHLIKK